jgi:small subunit ribosomal protein S9
MAVSTNSKKIEKTLSFHGVGRRKSAVARAWLKLGNGLLQVNGKDFKDYFDTEATLLAATFPLEVHTKAKYYDVTVNVVGGGRSGQADAVKLAISRALLEADENARPLLREYGLLTSDARVKERKKYGQKAARRKFQFVKR